MDHRLLIKKLMIAEFDWLGHSELASNLDDECLSYAKFSPEEIAEMKKLHDEAYRDWLVASHANDKMLPWNPTTCTFEAVPVQQVLK